MTAPPTCFLNPLARHDGHVRGVLERSEYDDVAAFFDVRPDLAPTPLRRLDALAAELGVRDVRVKDESCRFDLNAFKIVGVTYAIGRLLAEGALPRGEAGVLVTASTGNHGRAVARVARGHGLRARIYVPAGTSRPRVAAIEQEGAEAVLVDGSYEDAIVRAAEDAAREGWTVVSDTAYPGYERIPRCIMAGYTRLVAEAWAEWRPDPPPTLVIVQAGVGGLAGAVASWWAHQLGNRRPFVAVCEPLAAAGLQASARAGRLVAVEGPLDTAMAGLRCAAPSSAAWPAIVNSVDAFLGVADADTFAAMRRFARPAADDPPIVAGPSGACGLAALTVLAQQPALAPVRGACGFGPDTRVLLFNTEGDTDPALYAAAVA